MNPQPLQWRSALAALAASIIWGGNLVALKYGLATFPPFWSALWRMAAGAAAVGVWAWVQGDSLRPRRGEAGMLAALALMFTVQITMLNFGGQWTSPGYAVVLLNSHPLFTNLFGQFFAGEERLDARRAIGLALAFGGICWVSFGRPEAALAPRPALGNLLMVASAALLALRVLFTRRLVQTIEPNRTVFWQLAGSVPVFVVLGGLFEAPTLQPVAWDAAAAILYQGVLVAGVCFIIWTGLLRRHSAGTLSVFGFTVPFFGVFLSAWVFDEAISGRLLLGAALVTAGIVLVTRAGRRTQTGDRPFDR